MKFDQLTLELSKKIEVVLYDMNCVNLSQDAIKILGTHVPYNKKLQKEVSCEAISKVVYPQKEKPPLLNL